MSLIIKMDSIIHERHLYHAIYYVMNETKTEGLTYSNAGTSPKEIIDTFAFTRENVKNHGKRSGYHYKFSFSKDENVKPEIALAFIKDWSDEYLGDKYDYVCAVHNDRDHLHMHLIFNAICRDGGKYRYEKGDWDKVIKPLTNRLADKYSTGHLRERDESLDYDKSKENQINWKNIIKKDIDKCIKKADSYEEFKEQMLSDFGYKLREGVSREYGVYLSLTPPGKAKAVRSYQLGDEYAAARIDERIRSKKNIPLENPNENVHYKRIYTMSEVWFVGGTFSYIPYERLSMYQKHFVRKMLDAKRLYRGTGSTLVMKERASRAIKGITEDASFICRFNVRTSRELNRMIEGLAQENAANKKVIGPMDQWKNERQKVVKKLKELENPTVRKRKDVNHK